jgi:AraC family transcriptional regulator
MGAMPTPSDDRRPAAPSTGHFVSWGGGCLMIGSRSTGPVPMHAHYAIQISFGSEHGIRFRTSEADEWTEYHGAIVPSQLPHSMDATRQHHWAVLFVEPETREGRALTELYLGGGIAAIPERALADVGPALFSAWLEARSQEALTAASWRVIQTLTGGVEPSVASDERILRAIAYINAHLGSPLTLEEVAAEAFLSPSRFRHLFVEQTGMGLRPYILWRRFLRVWELVMAGASLSEAAHDAGFADAAHLTRTSRRMFGFPPSVFQRAGPLKKSAPTFN